MKLLDRLEKRFGHWAVPNVIATLVIAQVFMYGMILIGRVDYGSLLLIPRAVLGGEWWRIVTFLFAPPFVAISLIQTVFLAFFWYLFWMMSSALEGAWGVFRFNMYLIAGILLTLIGAFLGQFLSPDAAIHVSPKFLYLSVFFAFATLNPNFEFLVMFVIPMKVKWMAWFLGAVTLTLFLFAPSMGHRVAILGSLLNYLLFFRNAMTHSVKTRKRQNAFQKRKEAADAEAFHVCHLCGATDKTSPDRGFRYKTVKGRPMAICDVCREAAADPREGS